MTTFWQLIPNNSHWTRLKIGAWKPTSAKETGNVSTWRTAAPRCEEPVEVTAPLLWKCSSVTERRPRDPGADSLEGTVSQLTCEAQVELKGMNGACVSAVILYSDAAPIRAQTSCIEDVALSDKLTNLYPILSLLRIWFLAVSAHVFLCPWARNWIPSCSVSFNKKASAKW